MDKADRDKLFTQFYLANSQGLALTKSSSYAKVQAGIRGCLIRSDKGLYKGEKYFIEDLQALLNFDPQSADLIFKEHSNRIRYKFDSENQANNRVFAQCRRCGKFTRPFKFCPKCEDVHYCSETCEVNVKLTHEKQECRIKMYPKIQHATLVEVHFGSNLGNNVEVYFQHETRASALFRGKEILTHMHQYFTGLKNINKVEMIVSKSAIQDKIEAYNVVLNLSRKMIEFALKNEKDYPTGVLKMDIESLEDIKRIYEQNPLLDQIELYLLSQGGILTHCAEEIHNNHVHYVYIFRIA